MSRGFKTADIPGLARKGIKKAFAEWEEMSGGAWLHTAPEYHITVCIAQAIASSLKKEKRTLVMEGSVAKSLEDAGAIQKGSKAKSLRHAGRYDIVVGSAQGIPRVVIEVKNRLWHPAGELLHKDLRRICESLLRGQEKTNLHSGVLAFYTDSAPAKRRDVSAGLRILRKFGAPWNKVLQDWNWAPANKRKLYKERLTVKAVAEVETHTIDKEDHGWAAVTVSFKRRPTAN